MQIALTSSRSAYGVSTSKPSYLHMANLDFAATQQLKEILPTLKKQGKALLLSEHRLYYLADIADEFWGMSDGEIHR